MNEATKSIVLEALNTQLAIYESWLRAMHSTEAERELAKTKMMLISLAIQEVS